MNDGHSDSFKTSSFTCAKSNTNEKIHKSCYPRSYALDPAHEKF